MHVPTRAAAAALVALFSVVDSALGQIDYRNLDDDRPTLTEDAYPIERYAFELIIPYLFENEPGPGAVHAFTPEIAAGLFRNFELGCKAPVAMVRGSSTTDVGLSGLRLFALYNVNTESPLLPAVSLRLDASLPVGPLAGSGTRAAKGFSRDRGGGTACISTARTRWEGGPRRWLSR